MASSVWERGSFTVPDDVPHERVCAMSAKYMQRFGQALEAQGFTVLNMSAPQEEGVQVGVAKGRRKYIIQALVTRRPVTVKVDVPDQSVPAMVKQGYKLLE